MDKNKLRNELQERFEKETQLRVIDNRGFYTIDYIWWLEKQISFPVPTEGTKLYSEKKKIKMFNYMDECEKFINRDDIEVISVDLKVVEQSMSFQDGFVGIVFYKEIKTS